MAPEIAFTATADFDFGSAEYGALFQRSACSPFQHPDWLSAFYGTLARGHPVEPLIVVGRRVDTGALALVMPLVKRRKADDIAIEHAFLGVCDYARPIIDPAIMTDDDDGAGPSKPFLRALGPFDRLEIAPVRQDDVAAWARLLGSEPAALGFHAHHLRREPTAKPHLARKMRRLAKRGPLAVDLVGEDEVRSVLMAARQFRFGRFRDDPMQMPAAFDFYVEVATRGQRSGLARLYRLSCGDDLVAVLFGLIHDRRFCYLVLGCDYAQYGRFSPGMIMFAKVMKHWFEGGGEIFDFTIGDEAFKSALGCERTPMFRFQRAGLTRRIGRVASQLAESADA